MTASQSAEPKCRRTSIQLTERQRRELDQLAEREQRSVAFLVREAIDLWLQAFETPEMDGRDDRE